MRRQPSSHYPRYIAAVCMTLISTQLLTLVLSSYSYRPLPTSITLEVEGRQFSTPSASLIKKGYTAHLPSPTVASRLLHALHITSVPRYQNPFDREIVAIWIEEINTNVSRPATPSAITLGADKKSISIFPGNYGSTLPLTPSVDVVLHLDLNATTAASLSMMRTGIELSQEQIQESEKFALQFIGKSLSIEAPSFRQLLRTEDILPLVDPPNRYSEVAIDDLRQLLDGKLATPPIEPELLISSNGVEKFIAPKEGRRLNQKNFSQSLREKLTTLETQPSIDPLQIQFDLESPKKSLANTNTIGISQRIGLGESSYAHSIANRVANVSLTTTKIHARLIFPGEEFSFNKYLGEVSAKTGFKPAYVIKDGQTILGDGGGVCQVSSTLFRAVLNSGLPITERRAHSYRVGYYEQNSKPGFDATVFSPHPDFRFVNDTGSAILINAIADPKSLTMYVELWGTADGRNAAITNYKQWGAAPAPPTIYQDDPSLPPGKLKQIEFAAPGLKTSFDYVVTYPNGEKKKSTFTSSYKPWAAVYMRGI